MRSAWRLLASAAVHRMQGSARGRGRHAGKAAVDGVAAAAHRHRRRSRLCPGRCRRLRMGPHVRSPMPTPAAAARRNTAPCQHCRRAWPGPTHDRRRGPSRHDRLSTCGGSSHGKRRCSVHRQEARSAGCGSGRDRRRGCGVCGDAGDAAATACGCGGDGGGGRGGVSGRNSRGGAGGPRRRRDAAIRCGDALRRRGLRWKGGAPHSATSVPRRCGRVRIAP
eukprot:359290-Chlamydomonas_euryale.AAC.11